MISGDAKLVKKSGKKPTIGNKSDSSSESSDSVE